MKDSPPLESQPTSPHLLFFHSILFASPERFTLEHEHERAHTHIYIYQIHIMYCPSPKLSIHGRPKLTHTLEYTPN